MKHLQVLALSIVTIIGVSTWAGAQDYGRDRYGDQQVRNPVRDAYQQGLRDGEFDARHDKRPIPRRQTWLNDRVGRAYQIGYDRGFDQTMSERGGWTDREAYRTGFNAGDWDARHSGSFNPRPLQVVRDEQGRRAYLAGYNRGFHDVQAFNIGGLEIFLGGRGRREQNDLRSEGLYNPQYGRSDGDYNQQSQRQNQQRGDDQQRTNDRVTRGSLTIQGNNNVTWQTQFPNSRVFVQEDNKPEQLFASGASGTQAANWLTRGHSYTFILRDPNGNELARSQIDMR